MKDKEKLLSSIPIEVHFFHYAQREGWDNPLYSQTVLWRNVIRGNKEANIPQRYAMCKSGRRTIA
jgi:hypothetical protein